jgi:hypothetical protein
MDAAGVNWTLITIIGAVILAAVIAWAALRNRADNSQSDHDGTTKRLYQEEDAAHRGESDNVP